MFGNFSHLQDCHLGIALVLQMSYFLRLEIVTGNSHENADRAAAILVNA